MTEKTSRTKIDQIDRIEKDLTREAERLRKLKKKHAHRDAEEEVWALI